MSQNQLARIERGMRRVSLVQLERLAAALETNVLNLLTLEQPGSSTRLPAGIVAAWPDLSATDRRLISSLVERLANR